MAGRLSKIGKRERVLLVVLGSLVVLGGGYLMLSGGGEETTDTGGGRVIVPRRPTTSSPAPTSSPGGGPTQAPDTLDPADARDPFRSPLEPGDGGSPTGSPGATPTPGATGGTQTGTRVVLLDIFVQDGVRFASVQVGGETHNVKEGDTFAGSFRVVSITESCATFVHGDERFTLCIGQEVFK